MLDITGMTNPNILRRSNSDAIRHRVLSGSGNMESTSIKKSDSISGGIVSSDSIFLKNVGTLEQTIMLYNFSYDQDLNSGDSIAIKLPFFFNMID